MFEANNLYDGDNLKSYPNVESTEPTAEENKWPSSKGVCELLICFASIKNLSAKELKEISLKCLLLANIPVVKAIEPSLSQKFLKKIVLNNPESKVTEISLTTDEAQNIINQTESAKALNRVSFIQK